MPYAAPTHSTSKHDDRRGNANERGYGRAWQRMRAWHIAHNPLCVACMGKGIVTPATDVDHIIAKRKGGMDRADNLQSLCHACHSIKTAKGD